MGVKHFEWSMRLEKRYISAVHLPSVRSRFNLGFYHSPSFAFSISRVLCHLQSKRIMWHEAFKRGMFWSKFKLTLQISMRVNDFWELPFWFKLIKCFLRFTNTFSHKRSQVRWFSRSVCAPKRVQTTHEFWKSSVSNPLRFMIILHFEAVKHLLSTACNINICWKCPVLVTVYLRVVCYLGD